jgi:diadenylate cyclase
MFDLQGFAVQIPAMHPFVLFITFRWLDALDIIVVALLLYQLFHLIRGTVAVRIFLGILLLYLVWLLVRVLNMQLLESILGQFVGVGVLALVVVFQQEIRKFLLAIGTADVLKGIGLPLSWLRFFGAEEKATNPTLDALVRACATMAQSQTGAIIVLKRMSNLDFYIGTGEQIDAAVSEKLLESVFYKNSPLHDGAVIIVGNRIVAARAVLPVTEKEDFPVHLGMRHRAAVGLTETSDALAIVVSEQTGGITLAKDGVLHHGLSPKQLREMVQPAIADGKE